MSKDEISMAISNYLYTKELEKEGAKKQLLLSLYANYRNLNKLQSKLSKDNGNICEKYENYIYKKTDGVYTDYEKIELELEYCENLEIKDNSTSLIVSDLLNEIKTIFLGKKLNPEDILNIKKKLVQIQILTGQDITFYEAAHELFFDYYEQIKKEINGKAKNK